MGCISKTCRFYASLGYSERTKILTTGIRWGNLSKTEQDLLIEANPSSVALPSSAYVRLKPSKNTFFMANPYIYGTKNSGSLPYQFEFEQHEAKE